MTGQVLTFGRPHLTPALDSSYNGDKGLARIYLRNGLSRKTALHRCSSVFICVHLLDAVAHGRKALAASDPQDRTASLWTCIVPDRNANRCISITTRYRDAEHKNLNELLPTTFRTQYVHFWETDRYLLLSNEYSYENAKIG